MDNDQRSPRPRAGDPAEVPWARTTTAPPAGAHSQPSAPGQAGRLAPDAAFPGSARAVAPPVWSGKKTAIAVALAIGFASVGAVGAAAVLPSVSPQTGQQGQLGQQGQAGQPNQPSQGGAQQLGGTRHFVGRVPGGSDDDGGAGGDDDGSTN